MEVRRFKGSFVAELGLDDGAGAMELFGRGLPAGTKYDTGGSATDNAGLGATAGAPGTGLTGNKGDRLAA